MAAVPSPSGSTSYWFIPFDPNNTTNKISSTSPTPPRSVTIFVKNLVITGANSAMVMRVATSSGTGVVTATYGGIGTYTTSNGNGSITNVNTNLSSATSMNIYVPTNSFLISTTSGRPLTGTIDISWYIPTSGNGQINVCSNLGCYDSGGNQTQQVSNVYYNDTYSNVGNVIGVSLILTASGSPFFSSGCVADVMMERL